MEKRGLRRFIRDNNNLNQISQVPAAFKRAKHISKQDVSEMPPYCVESFLTSTRCCQKSTKWSPISTSPLFLKLQCLQTV